MRPSALPVLAANIPDALKNEHRWTVWRYRWSQKEGKAGRWIKLPQCKTNEPDTWLSFADALGRYELGYDGIGFCLGDGWAGLDLDHGIENGILHPDVVGILDRIGDGYVEVSPSGTGHKALGRSPRIGGEWNFETNARTAWQGARFFTITGHTLPDCHDPTTDLSDLIAELFPQAARITSALSSSVPAFIKVGLQGHEGLDEPMTDDEVVERILASTQADKFAKLVRGDTSDYGGDRSRADQALLSILAYWCNGDRNQIDQLYRQSGLMRAKWETRSYREASLNKALALRRATS